MVRLKVAVAAGVLADGFAIPSAASTDTAQVVYAWGNNSQGQAGTGPIGNVLSMLSPVPVHGSATNVAQLAGGKGEFVLSLRSDGTMWGWGNSSYR